MIKCDMGTVGFKGNRIILQAELCAIMGSFVEQGVADKEDLIDCVEKACMTDEELKESAEKGREKCSASAAELIERLARCICGLDEDKEEDD